MQRKGQYPPPPGAADIPGLEVAGEVAGARRARHPLRGRRPGRWRSSPAAAMPNTAPVHETNRAADARPASRWSKAAAIPETFFTVWPNLFERGRLAAGETVLIHGGSSGIGTTAIQLAKAFGATVIVTAGSDAKCAACLKLGADRRDQLPHARISSNGVRQATGGRGADVILDMVGGDYVARNYAAAAEDGRIVQIATQHGGPRRDRPPADHGRSA